MRRILLVSSLLAGLVAFGSKPAQSAISADINIHVGDRAPVAYVYNEPRGYLIPDQNVWYYQNASYDMFRYGNVWYMNNGGYWYSARSWRGPFVGIRYESVPTRIVRVPSRYHRQTRGYWQTQQQAWNQNQWNNQPRYRNDDGRNGGQWSRNDDDNDQGNNHGRGNGKGNGKGHNKGNGNGNGRWD